MDFMAHKKVEATENDRFTAPKPAFKAPTVEYLSPPVRNSTPATSVAVQVANENIATAKLITDAKDNAAQAVNKIDSAKKMPRKKNVVQDTAPKERVRPWFCEAHKLSDENFIAYTRYPMTVADKGAVSLLFANGGEQLVNAGLTYAQAWDALRRQILARIAGVKGKCEVYKRFQEAPKNVKIYVPGLPTAEDKARKEDAEAKQNKMNKYYMNSRKVG